MAEDVNLGPWGVALSTLLLATHPAGALAADPVPDPTRPPPTILKAEGPSGAETGQDGEAAGQEQAMQLEMVMLKPSGAATAVVSGQTVRAGDTVRGMKVLAIREMEVELRGSQGVEVLRMATIKKDVILPPKTRQRQDQKK